MSVKKTLDGTDSISFETNLKFYPTHSRNENGRFKNLVEIQSIIECVHLIRNIPYNLYRTNNNINSISRGTLRSQNQK